MLTSPVLSLGRVIGESVNATVKTHKRSEHMRCHLPKRRPCFALSIPRVLCAAASVILHVHCRAFFLCWVIFWNSLQITVGPPCFADRDTQGNEQATRTSTVSGQAAGYMAPIVERHGATSAILQVVHSHCSTTRRSS
jgi:hypothetical protein